MSAGLDDAVDEALVARCLEAMRRLDATDGLAASIRQLGARYFTTEREVEAAAAVMTAALLVDVLTRGPGAVAVINRVLAGDGSRWRLLQLDG